MTGAWEYELPGSSTRPTSVEEGEALYRAALTALGEGVIIQDADSTIVAANAAAPRILGLSMDQLLGRTSLDPGWRVVHRDGSPFPGDTHPVPVALREHRAVRDVVMGVPRPDGTIGWIMVNVEPIRGVDGVDPGSVVCSYTDITAQTEADDRYRLLADNSRDVIVLLGPDRRIQFASPSVAQTLGWEPEALVGQDLTSLVHPDDLPVLRQRQDDALRAGMDRGETEFRLRTSAGSWKWLSVSGRLLLGPTGDKVGDLSTMRDIQAEVEARSEIDAARAELEAAYRLLAENSTGVVFRGDNRGIFSWISETVVDLVGWTPRRSWTGRSSSWSIPTTSRWSGPRRQRSCAPSRGPCASGCCTRVGATAGSRRASGRCSTPGAPSSAGWAAGATSTRRCVPARLRRVPTPCCALRCAPRRSAWRSPT